MGSHKSVTKPRSSTGQPRCSRNERLAILHWDVARSEKIYRNYLSENIEDILRELYELREEWGVRENVLEEYGRKSGLFATGRHGRRWLAVLKCLDMNHLTTE